MTAETRAEEFVRFMAFVQVGLPGECWEWTGNCPGGRHGHFSVGTGKTVKAHRWIYDRVVGPIHKSLLVRHKCDNPKCVNPVHLELGTSKDNTQDAITRGRWPDRSGELHPLARITETDVRIIRLQAALGKTYKAIAANMSISHQQVGKIVRRENWDHV